MTDEPKPIVILPRGNGRTDRLIHDADGYRWTSDTADAAALITRLSHQLGRPLPPSNIVTLRR